MKMRMERTISTYGLEANLCENSDSTTPKLILLGMTNNPAQKDPKNLLLKTTLVLFDVDFT